MSKLFGDDYEGRKAIPIFEGVLMYFPKAIAAVAEVSEAGNKQHNPGQPLHWARGKSMDQYNTAIRHLMDHRMGNGRQEPAGEAVFTNNGWIIQPRDKDGVRHLAKAAWRVLAALELAIEEEEAAEQKAERVKQEKYSYGDEYEYERTPDGLLLCTASSCEGHKVGDGVCTGGVRKLRKKIKLPYV